MNNQPSPGSPHSSESSSGFLSWDRSRRSSSHHDHQVAAAAAVATAVGAVGSHTGIQPQLQQQHQQQHQHQQHQSRPQPQPSSFVPNNSQPPQSSSFVSSQINNLERRQQQQQQHQQQSYYPTQHPLTPNSPTTNNPNENTATTAATNIATTTTTTATATNNNKQEHSPTPFRPMQPREFNLRRLHPTITPLPILPADVSNSLRGSVTSSVTSSKQGGGAGGAGGGGDYHGRDHSRGKLRSGFSTGQGTTATTPTTAKTMTHDNFQDILQDIHETSGNKFEDSLHDLDHDDDEDDEDDDDDDDYPHLGGGGATSMRSSIYSSVKSSSVMGRIPEGEEQNTSRDNDIHIDDEDGSSNNSSRRSSMSLSSGFSALLQKEADGGGDGGGDDDGGINNSKHSSMSSGFSASLRKEDDDEEDDELIFGEDYHNPHPHGGGPKAMLKPRLQTTSLGRTNEPITSSSDTAIATSTSSRPKALASSHQSSHQSSQSSSKNSISADYVIEDLGQSSDSIKIYTEEILPDGGGIGGIGGVKTPPSTSKNSFRRRYRPKNINRQEQQQQQQQEILPHLPEKRPLDVDDDDVNNSTTTASSPTGRSTIFPDTPESEHESIEEVMATTPMSVSTISPNEKQRFFRQQQQQQHPSLLSSSPKTASDSSNPTLPTTTTATASARFGRLLEECRMLTETCGESVVSVDDKDSNTSYRGSSLPSSSHRSSTSKQHSSGGGGGGDDDDEESNDKQTPTISSSLQLKAAAAARAASVNPILLQKEINLLDIINNDNDNNNSESNNLKVSNLTMDPEIMDSMRSSGFASSGFSQYPPSVRGSMLQLSAEFIRPDDYLQSFQEEETPSPPLTPKKVEEEPSTNAVVVAANQSSFVAATATNTTQNNIMEVPTKDNPNQQRRRLSTERETRINDPISKSDKYTQQRRLSSSQREMRMSDPISKSAMSDLSVGVDLMYGDNSMGGDLEEVVAGWGLDGGGDGVADGGGDGSIKQLFQVDDETASFNPAKFLMDAIEKESRSGLLSDLSMSEKDENAMMRAILAEEERKQQESQQQVVRSTPQEIEDDNDDDDEEGEDPMYNDRVFQPAEEIRSTSSYDRSSLRSSQEGASPIRSPWSQKTNDAGKKEVVQEEKPVAAALAAAIAAAAATTTTTTNNNIPPPQSPKEAPPSIESPVESIRIHNNTAMAGSHHSTNFSSEFSEDSGGLLVGFGQRRGQKLVVPSEASSISSSETSGSSSSSSGSGSGSFGSSNSSGSSSLSTSSEESSSLPAISRLHIPNSRDSQSDIDMVSELSFGGASALMAIQERQYALKNSLTLGSTTTGQEGVVVVGGGGLSSPYHAAPSTTPTGSSKKSSESSGASPPEGEAGSGGINFRPRLGSTDLSGRRVSADGAQPPVLEKLDEVSESNASFLDDISSIMEPNNAVQKFLSEPADTRASNVWSSFASTKSPPAVPQDDDSEKSSPADEVQMTRRRSLLPPSSSSRNSSRTTVSSLQDNSPMKNMTSAYSTQQQQHQELPVPADHANIHENKSSSATEISEKMIPIKPPNPPSDSSSLPKSISVKSGISPPPRKPHDANIGMQRSNSHHSNSSASSNSLSSHQNTNSPASSVSHPQNSHATSRSSGSYYGGVVARAAALNCNIGNEPLLPSAGGSLSSASRSRSSWSRSQLNQDLASGGGGGGGAQDAGIKTIESVRSMSSTSSSRSQEVRFNNISATSMLASRAVGAELQQGQLDRVHEESMNVDNQRQGTQQGSGESPLENMHPNVDDISSMSSVVSKARGSFSSDFLPTTAFASSQTKGLDAMSASSKVSGLSERSRGGQVVTKGLDAMSASSKRSGLSERSREELVGKPRTALKSEVNEEFSKVVVGQVDEVRSGSHHGESAVSANVAHEKLLLTELDKLSMKSGDETPFNGEELYEDFPSQMSDDDMILRKRSSCSSQFSPTNVETDSRKPWRTSSKEAAVDHHQGSDHHSSHMDSQENFGKTEPEHVELQRPMDDERSGGSLSELFESNEALERMGLFENSAPDVFEDKLPMAEQTVATRKHMSRSSNASSSSSITEWDFSGPARVVVASTNDHDHDHSVNDQGSKSNSSKSGLSHHSMGEEQPELFETLQDSDPSNTKIDGNDENENYNDKVNRSSAADLLASTADEMTELLRRSSIARSQQQMSGDDFSSDESSSRGVDSIMDSLESNEENERPDSPCTNEEYVSDEENQLMKGDSDEGSSVGKQGPSINSTTVEVSYHKSFDEDSKESEVSDHKSFDEDSKESEKDSLEPQLNRRQSIEFLRDYQSTTDLPGNDESERTSKLDNTSSGVPNPFLDDSFDEEVGVSPSVLSLSIGQEETDEEKDEEMDNVTRKKRQKCWKHPCWVFAILVVVASVVAIAVTQSKKKTPSEPSNPSVGPPSNPQTAIPTRLPTSLPTVNITPNWVQVGGDLSGESPGDEAGFSMSISETGRVIIGARRNAKDGLKNRGAARIFQFDSNTGFYVPIWDIYGEAAGDQCGFSVSMSKNGKRVAVGSLGSDTNGQNSGQVRIFDENELTKTWNLVSELAGEEETSLFGASVSLSHDGSNLAVGAPYHSEGTDMERSGRSYVYREVQESTWEPVGGPMFGTSSNDLFGWSVSFLPNAEFVAVGAPRLEGSLDSGYVKVFSFVTNDWKVYGEPMSIGVPGDRFGFSVSLAGGDTLHRVAIGAPGMGENGEEGSGLASVYENNGDGWQRSGDDLIGDGWGDNLGYAVSMTPDGTRMVVGVPNKKLDGVPVGQVQVVDVQSGTLRSLGDMYGRDGEKFGVSVSVSYEGRLVYGGTSMANHVRAYGEMYQG